MRVILLIVLALGAGSAYAQKPTWITGIARNPYESAHPELWRGLVGLWAPSVGVQGMRLWDFSINRNHGVMTNMTRADWIGSEDGWALDFDGGDDFVDVDGSFPDLASGDSATVTAWINLNATPGGFASVFAFGFTGNNPILSLTIAGNLSIIGFLESDTSAQVTLTADGSALTVGEWAHVAVVYDRSSGNATRYFNGSQTGTIDDISAVTGQISTLGNIHIGRLSSGFELDVKIGDLHYFDRALTATDIQQLHQNSYGGILHIVERQTRWFVAPPVGGARRVIIITPGG